MFGFLKRAEVREHAKLMHQNFSAAHYIRAFDPELADMAIQQVEALRTIWEPGKALPAGVTESALGINRELRRTYDRTPGKYVEGKSFDDAFQPILGWKRYFVDLGLD